jgi:hypothetical protein
MGLRVVMRWIAFGAPYPWFGFATRFRDADDIVGTTFFQEFAKAVNAGFVDHVKDAGLMNSMDDIGSKSFDPSLVHPLIREFYEHTARFELAIKVKWNPLIRPFGKLYRKLIADRLKQLVIPFDNLSVEGLDSWLQFVDLDRDGIPEFRCWIRVLRETQTPVYVGAYRTFQSEIDGTKRGYVSVAFPLPGGNMTTVLAPSNLDGNGFQLSTRTPKSTETGVYLIIPHGNSFTMVPAFGLSERFHLHPDEGANAIDVTHTCFWLRIWAFEMTYRITRRAPTPKRAPAAGAVPRAWESAARAIDHGR